MQGVSQSDTYCEGNSLGRVPSSVPSPQKNSSRQVIWSSHLLKELLAALRGIHPYLSEITHTSPWPRCRSSGQSATGDAALFLQQVTRFHSAIASAIDSLWKGARADPQRAQGKCIVGDECQSVFRAFAGFFQGVFGVFFTSIFGVFFRRPSLVCCWALPFLTQCTKIAAVLCPKESFFSCQNDNAPSNLPKAW